MKEECKLCVNGWGAPTQNTTDFSISSLMRPAALAGGRPVAPEPRHEAVLLSAYLFKLGDYPLYNLHDYYPGAGGVGKPDIGCNLCSAMTSASPYGYYQPAGPLIKETAPEAERTLARYHPTPHYHPAHPTVLQQYGTPYYPAELCYGRYFRPPGPPYHMPSAPQPEAQMVGVGGEPYPQAQYYTTPPCYQHSPQRIPYVEYRGCPCPLNACPKNVLIGPATGKAPTGGGPADVAPALVPPGGAFPAKVRACATADTHGSGKDPPLGPEPPAAADAPHPCPLPAIGSASPKRELYDIRDNLRLIRDITGSAEALGPPSPARGSAGACAPQPPPVAPRRARLGKEMARRSLAGGDTGLLLLPKPLPLNHNDADDDVLAISPPVNAPIDLSSSDERSTPLVDVKKENEGPTYSSPRKVDTQALREHNCSSLLDGIETENATKSVKRRYSRPKLEIEMKDVQLEDGCKTNGIGEHVKLQKRRKVSSEQTDIIRVETTPKDPKKKAIQTCKRPPKTLPAERKSQKRKLDNVGNAPEPKKIYVEGTLDEDPRLRNIAASSEESIGPKPKNKSALLLDNLIRKNSIDRPDAKAYSSDAELNPAELFLSPNETVPQNCVKKTFNINNNIVENKVPVNGVRANTLAAVSQLIEKKIASKNASKMEKVDSKITHNLKSVLKTPTEQPSLRNDCKVLTKHDVSSVKKNTNTNLSIEKSLTQSSEDAHQKNEMKDKDVNIDSISNHFSTTDNVLKSSKVLKSVSNKSQSLEHISERVLDESQNKVPISFVSVQENQQHSKTQIETVECVSEKTSSKTEKSVKRSKLVEKANGEMKTKSVEKVAKLLVSKKTAIKADEAALVVEHACVSPVPISKGRAGRRRSSAKRAGRRIAVPITPPDLEPRAQPRWSNGWSWDGDHYISKVYLNNDSRLDRTARCWSRMTHASGDKVARGDCVLLRASSARAQPFVARVARLWENPDDGEMMVSLVWYYRPEHTEVGCQNGDAPDEVFASRHRDANSVACIEDKCYVLTFNEYCRYRKRLKAAEEGIRIGPSIVPPLPASEVPPALATNDSRLPPALSPELVLFCRKIYDFRSKKIQVPNK